MESRPFQIKAGGVLQLGRVDYQRGTEVIYKAVKIMVEIGRGSGSIVLMISGELSLTSARPKMLNRSLRQYKCVRES